MLPRQGKGVPASPDKKWGEGGGARVVVVHLNFRAGSTFPVPVFTVPNSMDKTSQCNKVDTVRLYASYRWNLLFTTGADLHENETIWSRNRENEINHRTKSFKANFYINLKA